MTTSEAGRIAPPEDFPIVWDHPEDAEASWFQDVMHNPLPITPLTASLFRPAFAEGASRAFARLMLPVDGFNATVQNGYMFLAGHPFSTDPVVMEARLLDTQRVTMELAPTVLADWRSKFEPEVLAKAARVLADAEKLTSVAEAARFVVGLYPEIADVWDIHMRVNIPPMNAVFALEEMIGGVLGEEAVAQSRQLLQGFDNKSVETGRALWALSRFVRSDGALKAALLGARVRDGAVELGAGMRSAEFEQRFQAFLDTYGWRSDRFTELGHKSWHEDPSTPLTQLKDYVRMEDAADPFASHARQAAKRDGLVGEMTARLPEEMRPMFGGILMMAQQYIPIAEDHNFTIDQKFTAVLRHAILALGRLLVSAGTIADADDVFYLKFDEIGALAEGGSGDGLARSVKERRRELARQVTMKAPLMIGTLPPADAPPDPLISKFFGVGLIPSDDVNKVTGHPCSTGVVTGTAKIVPTLADAGKLEPGDILVCRMTMPAWTPLFGVASAVVADSGGPLSHCAIVAREYGIPCVAGTVNGTAVLKDGMRIRVDGGTGIVTVLDERTRG